MDYPGALHHVIVRGIERRKIFRSDRDRTAFLERLSDLVISSGAAIYAWALMPNHAHVLIRTGRLPLSRLMQRWLSGYATTFNLVHSRAGHLFQNRFKSVLVEEDEYFVALIRYIHLNPVRSRLPVGIDELDRYPWTGHAGLLGATILAGQDVATVLGQFASTRSTAVALYREFVREGVEDPSTTDLEGGGLRRSIGGWECVERLSRGRERWSYDERILGSSRFVEAVWRAIESDCVTDETERTARLDDALQRIASYFGVTGEELRGSSKRRAVMDARAVGSYLAVRHCGLSATAAGRILGVSRHSVIRAMRRLETVCRRTGCDPQSFLPT